MNHHVAVPSFSSASPPFRLSCIGPVWLLGFVCLHAFGIGLRSANADETSSPRPNVILCMADDMGWGDVAYNGHPDLRTPHLDAMSREGIRFDRFYSGSSVCSPTRGSCYTGRNSIRFGINTANHGRLLERELVLPEIMKQHGYRTGHFGKWHLGTLTTKVKDANRGRPGNTDDYSPPWEHSVDVSFVTESKVPTWNPLQVPAEGYGHSAGAAGKEPGQFYGTHYWIGPDQSVTENVSGDDSRVVMDRALKFISDSVENDQPFMAVIWFHTPHKPTIAGGKYLQMYNDFPIDRRHYYGSITALDDQVGRLRQTLADLGVDRDTMLWYCSDNGPEGKKGKDPGTAGHLRGRKRDLLEGGIRVPGILVWPQRISEPRTLSIPCFTSDYVPTIADVLGFDLPDDRPYDGISLLPWIDGGDSKRPSPLMFEYGQSVALIDQRYKLYRPKGKNTRFQLFDLIDDPGEAQDLASEHPELVRRYAQQLQDWRESCQQSQEKSGLR
ncbi:Choline-sulfatase [Crateriforma conspicua]|uniref:Choline-sulfatase n=1 Tax=Crateriforma conspicua TaxID=2527996 RepID=A0A5C6G1M8_9PLAN|nr:sulfatase-like hydrolase/transferase [Crateriforma conspicua]TWU67083.1 Choline-sulfatase [Crateriforma conspicua]